MTPDGAELRVHCIAGSDERAEAIGAIARALVPGARVSHAATPSLQGLGVPDVAVVDTLTVQLPESDSAMEPAASAAEAVRALRAKGFTGAIVVLDDAIAPPESTCDEDLSRLGATRVPTARLHSALSAAFAEALEPRSGDAGAAQLRAQLGRTRQLLSAGEIAIGLQHSMNNPLAAILAESQLLEMDDLSQEQREAVSRIVALCRRMTAVVRRLDGVGGSAGGAPPAGPER